jgi:hypothetical protein
MDELRAKLADLVRLRDELHGLPGAQDLDAAIRSLNRVIDEQQANGEEQGLPPAPAPARRQRYARPLRAAVLDALEDLQWPTYTRELALYCEARYGRAIAPARFGSLATDEVASYLREHRPRAVWLCFALTYDRAESIRRLWCRSDWPLERRIVAPTSGRVQHLKLTARLCTVALEAADTAADKEMLRIIAADHARDLPGVNFRRGDFPLESWRDVATDLLEKVEPPDEQLRREAAVRLHKLPEAHQLFGVLEAVEGVQRRRSSRRTSR